MTPFEGSSVCPLATQRRPQSQVYSREEQKGVRKKRKDSDSRRCKAAHKTLGDRVA